MPTTPRAIGPTAERVARNVQQLRQDERLSLQALSDRLTELGQPISLGQLSKLERGDRRVDVDDLVALAAALGVSPSRLLLTATAGPEDIDLTPDLRCSTDEAWRWAAGVMPLPRPGQVVNLDLDAVMAFGQQCAPHEAGDLTASGMVAQAQVIVPFRKAAHTALAAGVPEVTLRSLLSVEHADVEGAKRRGKH